MVIAFVGLFMPGGLMRTRAAKSLLGKLGFYGE
jgi:hypothetical protein